MTRIPTDRIESPDIDELAATPNRLRSAVLASRAAHRVAGGAAAAKDFRRRVPRYRWKSRPDRPGGYAAEPGIDPRKAQPDLDENEKWNRSVFVDVVEYGQDRVEFQSLQNEDMAEFLETERPEWAKVRWINVNARSPFFIRDSL